MKKFKAPSVKKGDQRYTITELDPDRVFYIITDAGGNYTAESTPVNETKEPLRTLVAKKLAAMQIEQESTVAQQPKTLNYLLAISVGGLAGWFVGKKR